MCSEVNTGLDGTQREEYTVGAEIWTHLIGLQSARVAGEPVHDVPGDDVPRAAGKGWVGRTGVLQFLPLAGSVHGPVQSETESQKEVASLCRCDSCPTL